MFNTNCHKPYVKIKISIYINSHFTCKPALLNWNNLIYLKYFITFKYYFLISQKLWEKSKIKALKTNVYFFFLAVWVKSIVACGTQSFPKRLFYSCQFTFILDFVKNLGTKMNLNFHFYFYSFVFYKIKYYIIQKKYYFVIKIFIRRYLLYLMHK